MLSSHEGIKDPRIKYLPPIIQLKAL